MGKVFLLPALPKAWPSGSLSGVRLPGSASADLTWKDGRVTGFAVTAQSDWSAEVHFGESVVQMAAKAGETAELSV